MTGVYDAIPLLGVPIHHRDLHAVLDTIDDFIRDGRRTGRAHQIVTVNTDFLVQARKHDDVHAILRNADLALADGMPVVWVSGALGQRLPHRIAGADLVGMVAERAAERGYRIMFFGGTGDVGERAAARLRAQHPGANIAAITGVVDARGGTPPPVLESIEAFRPDVICVALGHPKQERWIRRYGTRLGIPVGIGVGGSFDFIAGERKRAAPWIQRSGFEWLFRLAQEPRRLAGRYLTDIATFGPAAMVQITRTRLAGLRRHAPAGTDGDPPRIRTVRSDADSVLIELTRPGPLDQRSIAELTSMASRTRRQGRTLRMVAPDHRAIRSMQRLRVDRLLPLVPSSAADAGARPACDPSTPPAAEPPSPARQSGSG